MTETEHQESLKIDWSTYPGILRIKELSRKLYRIEKEFFLYYIYIYKYIFSVYNIKSPSM